MRRQLEPPVSYDGCEADIDGVILTFREWDVLKLDRPNAERLVTELDAAITQSRDGANRLAQLVNPNISDDEAALLLTLMDDTRGTDRIRCGICYCTPHRSECVTCGCDGRRP